MYIIELKLNAVLFKSTKILFGQSLEVPLDSPERTIGFIIQRPDEQTLARLIR